MVNDKDLLSFDYKRISLCWQLTMLLIWTTLLPHKSLPALLRQSVILFQTQC